MGKAAKVLVFRIKGYGWVLYLSNKAGIPAKGIILEDIRFCFDRALFNWPLILFSF